MSLRSALPPGLRLMVAVLIWAGALTSLPAATPELVRRTWRVDGVEREAFDLAGGGIENWFPYLLATVLLLVRPAGLFGERPIERV